jgi:polynucleotide 5'-kinase involved in rRNA processing
MPVKSPKDRSSYRQGLFDRYFQSSRLYDISLDDIAIQSSGNAGRNIPAGTLVGLRNEKGVDMAVGVVVRKSTDGGIIAVKAPEINIRQVRCIVVGDISIQT